MLESCVYGFMSCERSFEFVHFGVVIAITAE